MADAPARTARRNRSAPAAEVMIPPRSEVGDGGDKTGTAGIRHRTVWHKPPASGHGMLALTVRRPHRIISSWNHRRMLHSLPLSEAMPRTALVTGAGRRIGRAIALALGEAGFSVAVHYGTSRTEAEEVVTTLHRSGRNAVPLQADLGREQDARQLMQDATDALGPIGVLINNAAIFEFDAWHDATRDSWDRHMETNLRAPLVLAQSFAHLLPTTAQGAVINMIDQRVWAPGPGFISYTVAKSGLWTLTRTLALALAPRIRVNAIGPGPAAPSKRQTPDQFAEQCRSVPLGHGTNPDEIARAVLFLLSLPSVTGQMLALDGGQHLQGAGSTTLVE
ncbi:3-oxoacyl-[acyl-carrier protein] reductase [Granulibacter bethesdensis]|nr:3-oxoacyl-[acyl-carrier protein] reductase [Granulibacter bethesdensis]